MNCHRVQNLLSAYLDLELSSEERRLIRNHIFNCSTCAKNYEELIDIKRILGNLEPPTPIIEPATKFHLCYQEMIADEFANHPLVWGKRLLMTAGCTFLFLVTSFYLFPTNQPRGMTTNQDSTVILTQEPTKYQIVRSLTENSPVINNDEELEKDENSKILDDSLLIPGIPVSR